VRRGCNPRSRVSRKLSQQTSAVSSAAPNGESIRRRKRREGHAGFSRSKRLLRHSDFERVYESGRRHFSSLLTAFYLLRQDFKDTAGCAGGLRIGFTVGRSLGGAVERNRIKRRMREAVRLSHPPIGIDADVVFNPKKPVLTADFEALLNEVRRAFVVIEQKLAPKPAKGETG